MLNFAVSWEKYSFSGPLKTKRETSNSLQSSKNRSKTADNLFDALTDALDAATELYNAGGVYLYADTSSPSFFFSGGPDKWWVDNWDMYLSEMFLVRLLQDSPFTTSDPSSAAMYFVSQYSTHEAHYCFFRLKKDLAECGANVSTSYLLPLIQSVQASPWWARSNGHDHLFVFPWDNSWFLFPQSWSLLENVSYFGYNGDSRHLISIPAPIANGRSTSAVLSAIKGGGSLSNFKEILLLGSRTSLEYRCASELKKYLATFFGTIHSNKDYSKGIRQDLLELYGGLHAQNDILFHEGHVSPEEYQEYLTNSEFCLCPPGWAPWSPRLYNAISAGCIPVLFDVPDFHMALPFSDIVDWDSFVFFVPNGSHINLRSILSAIPTSERCRMRASLAHWAPVLLWSSSPDLLLLMALREAWQRVKAKKLYY